MTVDRNEWMPVGTMVLLAAVVFAVLRQGAYHQWQHQVFAVVVGIAAVALVASRDGLRSLTWAAIVVLPLFGSSIVSMLAATERSDARSTLLEIGMVGVGLAAGFAVRRSQSDVAIDAVIVIALLVAATAIWGVATHTTPWGRITEGVWRGSSSLTYANAAAAVCGPVALLTLAQAGTEGKRSHAAATTALLIGFASTQSRGGAMAFLLVGVAAIGYLGVRRFATTALPIAAGVLVGMPLLLQRAFVTKPAQPVLVVGMVFAGLVVTWVAWPHRVRLPRPELVLIGLITAAALGGLATGALDPITERFTLRSGTTAGGEQANVLFGDRAKEWSAAWDQVIEAPVLGHGPGNVDLRWVEGGRGFSAFFVHNEYLEFAVTNGTLGVIALLLSGTIVLRRIDNRRASAPLLLACTAFLLHSSVDFLWHIPALPVLFATLTGLAVGRSDRFEQPA